MSHRQLIEILEQFHHRQPSWALHTWASTINSLESTSALDLLSQQQAIGNSSQIGQLWPSIAILAHGWILLSQLPMPTCEQSWQGKILLYMGECGTMMRMALCTSCAMCQCEEGTSPHCYCFLLAYYWFVWPNVGVVMWLDRVAGVMDGEIDCEGQPKAAKIQTIKDPLMNSNSQVGTDHWSPGLLN